MKALLQKQQQDQAIRNMLAQKSGDRSIEDRVDHCKHLQYEKHQHLFAVYYTTIHKAAMDNSVSGLKHFLKPSQGKGGSGLHKRQTASNAQNQQLASSIMDALDEKGNGALHYAAERDAVDAIDYLAENKCNVNLKSSCGNTALMMASKENKIRAIETLLRVGADIMLRNNSGMNMVHFVAQGDHPQVILTVFEHMSYPYLSIAEESDIAVLSMTLSTKKMSETIVEGEEYDEEHEPSVAASKRGGKEVDDDAATIETSRDGRSITASKSGSKKLGGKLEGKSSLSLPATGRRTPLVPNSQQKTSSSAMLQDETMSFGAASKSTLGGSKNASQREIAEMSKILREFLNQPANNGTSPLHVACQYNSTRIVRLLMKTGLVDIESQDASGETPLHKAARKGYRDLYKLLRSFNAREDVENIFHETPKDLLVDSINY